MTSTSTGSSTTTTTTTSPQTFLSFPGEIRNQIYIHLLRCNTPINEPYLLSSSSTSLHPSILSTCALIHHEASIILYGLNTFHAHPSLLSSFPKLRSSCSPVLYRPYLSMITRFHINIRLDCDAKFSRPEATKAFSGLEALTIEVSQAQYGSCDFEVLRRFEGVRGVRRGKVDGSTMGFRGYVRWLEGVMGREVGEEVGSFEEEDWEARRVDGEMEAGGRRGYDIWTHGGR